MNQAVGQCVDRAWIRLARSWMRVTASSHRLRSKKLYVRIFSTQDSTCFKNLKMRRLFSWIHHFLSTGSKLHLNIWLWNWYFHFVVNKIIIIRFHMNQFQFWSSTDFEGVDSLRLRQDGSHFLQMTSPNVFSWVKTFKFEIKFHWNMFLRVSFTINHHWFR